MSGFDMSAVCVEAKLMIAVRLSMAKFTERGLDQASCQDR